MAQITYCFNGRLGNNLFQYFAAKVLCKHTKGRYVYSSHVSNPTIVKDDNFLSIYEQAKRGILKDNIKLDGFFQFDILSEEREYLRSLFVPENKERVNDTYTIGEIATYVKEFKNDLQTDTVMHVRLDDFKHEGHNSEILHPSCLLPIIEGKKVTIVCEAPKKEWEKEYLEYFKEAKMIHGTQLQDFSRLYYAKDLICSASSFCWVAALLGQGLEYHFPKHKSFCNIMGTKCSSFDINHMK